MIRLNLTEVTFDKQALCSSVDPPACLALSCPVLAVLFVVLLSTIVVGNFGMQT